MAFKAGAVAVVGRPNVGKSTFVNKVVGHKVSIVSDKPNTTRRSVTGIATTPKYQIVFLDTPGLHKAHDKLGQSLNESAKGSLSSVDVVLIVVDGSHSPSKEDEQVASLLRDAGWIKDGVAGPNVVLMLNKMDLIPAKFVQKNYDSYLELFGRPEVMWTSLLKNLNLDLVLSLIVDRLPEGDAIYPDDEFTEQPMRWMVAELVREKVLHLTRQEVPHAVAVVVDHWDDEAKPLNIAASIIVEREGQKAILIGKRGEMIKTIGTEARKEIEPLVGRRVFLELFVKIREDWRINPRMLKELDYL